jgi:hypothetical protein
MLVDALPASVADALADLLLPERPRARDDRRFFLPGESLDRPLEHLFHVEEARVVERDPRGTLERRSPRHEPEPDLAPDPERRRVAVEQGAVEIEERDGHGASTYRAVGG